MEIFAYNILSQLRFGAFELDLAIIQAAHSPLLLYEWLECLMGLVIKKPAITEDEMI